MAAKNMAELERMLMKELSSAMEEAAVLAKEDMREGTEYFYSGGEPVMYVRTGQLGNTPKISPVVKTSNSASFEAYLNQDGGYTTGDSPSMSQVLNLANYGKTWTTKGGRQARKTVGNPGFWERAEDKIENDFYLVIGSHFG